MDAPNKHSSILAIFKQYALFEIFILGIVSGMPSSILYTSLLIMLRETGFNLGTATGIAIALLPYSLKFLWAPVIDGFRAPLFFKLGPRKSWMIFTLMVNISIVLSINYISSFNNFHYILGLAFCYCFTAATYDIVYDAWRIERIAHEDLAIGGAVASFGYRVGALLTGAGVLSLVHITESWPFTMCAVGGIFFLGGLFILSVPDKSTKSLKNHAFNFQENIIDPFKNFLTRPLAKHILIAIVLYKGGEAMIAFVITPFYLELGFSKIQLAAVLKVFGVIATTFGTFAGGLLCIRVGYLKGLMVCGILQMLSNTIFIWMYAQGPVMSALFITVSIDNFFGGMGTAALIGYLGYLCNRNYTATQYALLSSTSTLINHSLVAYSGTIVEKYGWNNFFILSTLFCLPALALLRYISVKTNSES